LRLAIGSDEHTYITEVVIKELKSRGYEVELYGAVAGEYLPWPDVAHKVAERVAKGQCPEGILFCWTGTGVSIAANKVPGVRAALCFDAETARGARKWNHANILVMSLRLTSEAVAKEILDAWFSTPFGKGEDEVNVAKVREIEVRYRGKDAQG
jgi:ribose 5-phosphate isomerase B